MLSFFPHLFIIFVTRESCKVVEEKLKQFCSSLSQDIEKITNVQGTADVENQYDRNILPVNDECNK